MSYDLLLALTLFAFVSSITPGPNNLMLMASGANFGFRRTLPHLLGVGIGFTLMIVLVGVGLVQVFDLYPISHQILKVVSVIYLLWLAWKIANAAPPEGDVQSAGTPITFIQAALFQWVNPKAWTMALTAISAYTPDSNALLCEPRCACLWHRKPAQRLALDRVGRTNGALPHQRGPPTRVQLGDGGPVGSVALSSRLGLKRHINLRQ